MRKPTLLIPVLFASLGVAGCNGTECALGTIERNGKCEPATVTTEAGKCGPFTELQGDVCVPMFPPTECDPTTTMASVDPATGVTTCVGTGTGGDCSTPIACPTPTGSTKLTVCGQLFDFESNAKLAEGGGSTGNCDPAAPATSGPCALQILAFDAIAFGTNPMTAPQLAVDSVTIDKCGRYRVAGIETNGTGPFIGLGIDDAGQPLGPSGSTVTVGVAVAKADGPVIQNFEGFVVKASTAGMWQSSGGPPLSGGIYAAIYRKHKKGVGDAFENQTGVTITKAGNTVPAQDYYFQSAQVAHQTIDPTATATGANGTGLLTGASVMDSAVYSGQGGLGTGCRWEAHAAASLPGIVFIQVYRKLDTITGGPCND